MLRELQRDGGLASPEQVRVLARWSGWGAVPQIFDEREERFTAEREELRGLLNDAEWRAASRTTLNAHYTDVGLVQVMWEAVAGAAEAAGLSGLRVLEPGCGSGTFLGLAPAGSRMLGVEMDPTTAAIAAQVYPHAEVRAESFADTRAPAGSFDVVIGNVPFGKVALHDPVHNPGRHTLHNHFILKSLALTRPGGIVAVLSTHYTMDAVNPQVRREIAERADLVAAVRLPISAHQAAAGTQVITDLLVLRRRGPGEGPGDSTAWETTVAVGGDTERAVSVNRWFSGRPDRVIGSTGTRSGPFGPELDVAVAPGTDVAAELRARLQTAFEAAAASTPGWSLFGADTGPAQAPSVARMGAPIDAGQDHIEVDGAGFTVASDNELIPHAVPVSQAKELRALLGLRDTTVALLAAEAATAEDTDTIAGLRATLNHRYEAYVAAWGPINRFTLRRTGRTDAHGTDRMARITPPQGRFRIDPHSPAVYALEDFDAETGTAHKAPIMTGRVIAPRTARLGADTPADAVAISLDTYGRVDLDEIARLLGCTAGEALPRLAGLAFPDPRATGSGADSGAMALVPAPEYLSGNVRVKLAEALAAAERDGDGRWAANIAALTEVIPTDLTPAEIDARLGAAWVDAPTVQQFLRETLADPQIVVEHPGGSVWAVKGGRFGVLARSQFGTDRISAGEIVADLLQQKPIKVTDEHPDTGARMVNLTETVAAQEKADALGERFTEWLWADAERAGRLARTYNDTFNAIVLRSYDGAQMQLPGLTLTFAPRPHQVAAVARIISEPAVLLAHEVGAGKTAEMVIGAMELRRLGMVRKPAVVVPNHMLEQFTREWMQLYPQARVLAASIEDLGNDRRQRMVARIATGDWDAVIISRSAFERIPLSAGAQNDYLDGQLDDMRAQLANARGGGGMTVKRLEGALARAEERLKKLLDTAKDPGVTYEQTGIDYLFVDEAHGYKNLRTVSNIQSAAADGSNRATDLDMKLGWARTRHGTRVATFATATPIANSVSEAYTMQRFLRPDLLKSAGLTDFDTWAATFGEVTTDLELAPDGVRFRMQSRFAKFRNVPELLRMWHVSADIKTAEDLDLPTPTLLGGAPETIVVPASPQLKAFMTELSARADAVQSRAVRPEEDNMLRVSTHGRMAALDLRLLGRDPGEGTKLDAAARRIARIYAANADRLYSGYDTPGALQIVFCDLGTPHPGESRWSAYEELRDGLIERGVPAAMIRFIHEARNDKEKGELFAAARSGSIAVLIGSTEKMGVGTNVQARAVALHHLDCPWRPADLAQRDGRAMRQGNLNPEIEILRYVSEGSFDAYLWQTVERKARFISQVMRGRLDVREIEDIGDTALSYSEVKALATGDPRIMEKARVDSELTRLDRLERAHRRNHNLLTQTITTTEKRLATISVEQAALRHAVTLTTDTSGDRFAMTVAGRLHSERADASVALRRSLLALPQPRPGYNADTLEVATLGGFTVTATARRPLGLDPFIRLDLPAIPGSEMLLDYADLDSERPLGVITRLENRAGSAQTALERVTAEATRMHAEHDRAQSGLAAPFAHKAALAAARIRSQQLATELAEQPTPAPTPDPAPAGVAEPTSPTPITDNPEKEHPMTEQQHTITDTPARDRVWIDHGVSEALEDALAAKYERDARTAPSLPASPAERWAEPVRAVDPAILADPSWRRLAEAMDRLEQQRVDVGQLLRDQYRATQLLGSFEGLTTADSLNLRIGQATASTTPGPPGGEQPETEWNSDHTYEVSPYDYDWDPDGMEAAEAGRENETPAAPAPDDRLTSGPQDATREVSSYPDAVSSRDRAVSSRPESGVVPGQEVSSPPPRPDMEPPTSPVERWAETVAAIDPRVLADRDWPALARQLDRVAEHGGDVATLLREVTSDRPLPAEHTAASLDRRMCLAVPSSVPAVTTQDAAAGTPAHTEGPAEGPEMTVESRGLSI